MQGTIAKAVGAQFILHIFIEGFAHCRTQFLVVGCNNLYIYVLLLVILFEVIAISAIDHTGGVFVFGVLAPLGPSAEPVAVIYCPHNHLAAGSTLGNTHAKPCEFAV